MLIKISHFVFVPFDKTPLFETMKFRSNLLEVIRLKDVVSHARIPSNVRILHTMLRTITPFP